jgi:hypothetical protein
MSQLVGEGDMDANERWRRASESADRFSPFRRRPPVFVGLVTALVALISLAVFLGVAGLDIRQFWIAALVSVTAMMLAGSCFALLSNHKAKSSYIGEYRRLNKINPVSGHVTCGREMVIGGSIPSFPVKDQAPDPRQRGEPTESKYLA